VSAWGPLRVIEDLTCRAGGAIWDDSKSVLGAFCSSFDTHGWKWGSCGPRSESGPSSGEDTRTCWMAGAIMDASDLTLGATSWNSWLTGALSGPLRSTELLTCSTPGPKCEDSESSLAASGASAVQCWKCGRGGAVSEPGPSSGGETRTCLTPGVNMEVADISPANESVSAWGPSSGGDTRTCRTAGLIIESPGSKVAPFLGTGARIG
jgi:hypothetical protein